MRVLHHRGPFCENNPNKNLIINIKGESESVNFNSHRCASKKKKKIVFFNFFLKKGTTWILIYTLAFFFQNKLWFVCVSRLLRHDHFFFLHDGMFGLFFLICNSFFFFFCLNNGDKGELSFGSVSSSFWLRWCRWWNWFYFLLNLLLLFR